MLSESRRRKGTDTKWTPSYVIYEAIWKIKTNAQRHRLKQEASKRCQGDRMDWGDNMGSWHSERRCGIEMLFAWNPTIINILNHGA